MVTYTSPPVTVDGVVLQLMNDSLHVLLIRRENEPFKGEWALPGGYIAHGETMTDALRRVLSDKAGVSLAATAFSEQLYTFDTPVAQDPEGHAVSVVYYALGRQLEPVPAQSTESPAFFPVGSLPELAYQHAEIIRHALERLAGKATYTNVIFSLLPLTFALSQLQRAYEAVLGRPLDKRNFIKKFLALDLIEPTGQQQKEGAHRPAQLYRFKQPHIQVLSRSLD